jgi:hypothetical protein
MKSFFLGLAIGVAIASGIVHAVDLKDTIPNSPRPLDSDGKPILNEDTWKAGTYVDHRLEFLGDAEIAVDPVTWGKGKISLSELAAKVKFIENNVGSLVVAGDPLAFGESYIPLGTVITEVAKHINSCRMESINDADWDAPSPESCRMAMMRISSHIVNAGSGAIDLLP